MSVEARLVDKINKEWNALVLMYQQRSPLWLINNADEINSKHQIADILMCDIEELGLDVADITKLVHMNNVIDTVYRYCRTMIEPSYTNAVMKALGECI